MMCILDCGKVNSFVEFINARIFCTVFEEAFDLNGPRENSNLDFKKLKAGKFSTHF